MAGTVRILFLLLLVSALALHSCSNEPSHPAELAVSDSLFKASVTSDSILKSVDTLEIKKMIRQISYNLAYIQLNRKDTLGKQEGELLSSYFLLRKPLTIYLKKQDEIRKMNKVSREQCSNLRHDLKYNTIDKKLDLSDCIARERLRSGSITASLASIYPSVLEIIKSYRSVSPLIEERVKALKAAGGKEPAESGGTQDKDDDDE